jgi:hypothetical protein
MMILVPAALFVVFAKSEHRIHTWLLKDHADHERLLTTMSIEFAHSEAGRFVSELADKFDAATTADIYAYMRQHAELVLRAEDLLLARAAGAKPDITAADREGFDRLHALERKIGKTALLAIWPHLHYSREELAELYELESRTRRHA